MAEQVADKSAGRVLLPPTVEPRAYDLKITPDLERFTYAGEVKVSVDVVTATSEVQLHAKELHVSAANFTVSTALAVCWLIICI